SPAIEEIDAERQARNLRNFIDRVDDTWRAANGYPDKPTALEKSAVESWLLRLEDIEADLAPSALGHDLDLVKALQQGKTVFFHCDATVNVGTLEVLSGLLVQEK